MNLRKRKIIAISSAAIIVLIAIVAILWHSKSTSTESGIIEPAGVPSKTDDLTVIIEKELSKEQKIIAKEGDQAKVVDSDKTVINEFNYIFDENDK